MLDGEVARMRGPVVATGIAVGIVAFLVSGCTERSARPDGPDPAPVEVAALELGEPEVLDGVTMARLSPDGSRLLRLDRGLCVSAVGEENGTCVEDVAEVHPDARTAQWSPDGTKVVFTDDFFRLFDEPDVWVFDVESGEAENLTDDGVDDVDLGGGVAPGSLFDVRPSWSPDGSEIWFARAESPSDGVELMSVGADGGEVTGLRAVDCGLVELNALRFTADRAAWTCGRGDDNEVRVGSRTGDDETVVVPESGDGRDHAALAFSPDGSRLLVDSIGQYGGMRPSGGLAVVVPADGGTDPRPVAAGAVAFPTWAPGGEAIAFVELPGTLTVVGAAGEDSRTLLDEPSLAATTWQSLDWVDGYLMLRVDGETRRYPLGG